MRARRLVASVVVLLALAACATSPPAPADIAKAHLGKASAALRDQDSQAARLHLAYALGFPGEEGQTARFFEANPAAIAIYVAATKEHLKDATPTEVAAERNRLDAMQANAMIPAPEVESLRGYLIERSRLGNLDGTIEFTLSDDMRDLSLTESSEHMEIILSRTLEKAAASRPETHKQLPEIIAYAADPSIPASQKKQIESSLSALHIALRDLRFLRSTFPEFAKRFESESTTKAALVYTGGDRLAQADLMERARGRIKGVIWQDSPGGGAALVEVDRLRYNEREEQRRQDTIRYNCVFR